MALTKKVASIPLIAGVETGTDPKVQSEGMLKLENARIDRVKEIRKRYGTTPLSGTNPEPFITTWKDRPVLIGNQAVAPQSSLKRFAGDVYNAGSWDETGLTGPWNIDPATLMDVAVDRQESGVGITSGDIAESDDIRVVTYSYVIGANTFLAITTYRKSNNARLETLGVASGTTANMRAGIRCGYVGAQGGVKRLLVVYSDSSGVLYWRTINQTTGAIGSATAMNSGTALCDPTVPIDMTGLNQSQNDAAAIVMRADTATSPGDLRVVFLYQNGTEVLPAPGGSFSGVYNVSCYDTRDLDRVAVLICDTASGSSLNLQGWTENGVLSNANVVLWTRSGTEFVTHAVGCADGASTSNGIVWATFWDGVAGGIHPYYTSLGNVTVPAGGGACTGSISGVAFAGMALASSPLWSVNSQYVTLGLGTSQADQMSYYIMRQDGVCSAHVLQGFGLLPILAPGSPPLGRHTRPQLLDETGAGLGFRLAVGHRSGAKQSDYGISKLEINGILSSLNCHEGPDSLMIPGALPMEYTGFEVYESGFLFYPPFIEALTTAGSLTGTYGYIAVYEWTDGQGRRHQSAPSLNSTVVLAAQGATVNVATYVGTPRFNPPVKIVLYRTVANGAYYYRVAETDNVPSNLSVTFVDTLADSSLVANEPLYSQGRLENIPPAHHRVSCIHQDRHVYAHREFESTRVLYSQVFLPATGVEYNEGLLINVTPDGGRITGLASYQDRLIIFKETKTFACYGQGYAPNGGLSNYSVPQQISPTIGCIDQKTIVEVPQGLMFLSADGIYLLNQSLQVQEVGHPVDYHIAQNDYTSAAVIPELHIAVWMSSSDAAPAIVYDYLYDMWITWPAIYGNDCVVSFDGNLYWTNTADDTVRVQDRSVWQDDGSHVPLKIRTPWFSFNEVLGKFRLYNLQLLGQNLESLGLRLKTFFDFDPVVIDSQLFNVGFLGSPFDSDAHFGDGLAAGYTHKSLVVEAGTSRQKVRAVMVEVVDEALCDNVTPTEGYTLSAIAFEIGTKLGLHRTDIGAARRIR